MGSTLELCRDEIRVAGNVVLGIHSNVAGDSFGYTDGHAWISINDDQKTYVFGLWPDGHPRAFNRDPGCSDVRIGLEAGAIALVSRYYSLTGWQVLRLNAFLNEPTAWGYFYTCASWVARVMKEVLHVNIHARDYGITMTPRELGFQLQRLEKFETTSLLRPRRGAEEVLGSYR